MAITVVLGGGLLVSIVIAAFTVASIPREWKSWRHVYPVFAAKVPRASAVPRDR